MTPCPWVCVSPADLDYASLARVVWVLKELEPENWIHNGGTDFAVQLKPPSAGDVLGKVLTAEGTYTHWSLFNRFILANEILDAADSAGEIRHAMQLAANEPSTLVVTLRVLNTSCMMTSLPAAMCLPGMNRPCRA